MNRSNSDSDPKETAEEFMSRWSRRKQQAREEMPVVKAPQSAEDSPAPELPPVEELGMDSDYRDFFHPKVKESVRRAALKKLFSDPHFSTIDGMDIYLDDYSISEELPAAIMAELKQAQNILGWAKEDREAEAERERVAANLAAETPPAIAEAAPATPEATAPAQDTEKVMVQRDVAAAPETEEVLNQQDVPDAGTQNT